jgi:hypothetical protein
MVIAKAGKWPDKWLYRRARRSLRNRGSNDLSLSKLQDSQLQILQDAIRAGTDNRLNLDSVEIQSWVLARAQLDALSRARKPFGELEDAVQRPLDPGEKFIIAPELPALREPANQEGNLLTTSLKSIGPRDERRERRHT